ncbi:MAG: WbqC family protein, partial [Muribaculaceae bacterium]|nr:WbqC family protein [Muribaculaceae bacterium]
RDLTDVDVSYSFDPARRPTEPAGCELAPYWQVRADRLGFIPGLSILDSIFNLGPEARLLL